MPGLEPSKLLVGNNSVVESGSVVLGGDEDDFTIQISDLTFTIRVVRSQAKAPLDVTRISRDKMLILVSTWYSSDTVFKFKVGTLWNRELQLALSVEPKQNFHIIHYTFSMVR
jgi:hypothetical protein